MIKYRVPLVELLAGLAEECCELGQAALKLRRVYDRTNPTPENTENAIKRFHEEVADVQLYLDQIDWSRITVDEIKEEKLQRWEERLNMAERSGK